MDTEIPRKDMRRAERRFRSRVKFAARLRSFLATWHWYAPMPRDIDRHHHDRPTALAAPIIEHVLRMRDAGIGFLKRTPTRFSWPNDEWDVSNLTISALRRSEIPGEEARHVKARRSGRDGRRARRREKWTAQAACGWTNGGRCVCGHVAGISGCPNCPERMAS